jgi:hypothetical protein
MKHQILVYVKHLIIIILLINVFVNFIKAKIVRNNTIDIIKCVEYVHKDASVIVVDA